MLRKCAENLPKAKVNLKTFFVCEKMNAYANINCEMKNKYRQAKQN